ncbi:MAG: molybdenum cofactor guanylyltransferase [Rubrobacter sp.]|nr:molybdenum cofactor guanylyltransferase [Rubrobacter sp.]
MGRDKLPLRVGGIPLVRRVCETLGGVCEEVILVSAGEGVPGEVPEGVRPARDLRGTEGEGLGPLAGMEAGLSAASHPAVFVAAGDVPFLPGGMVRLLLRRVLEDGVTAAVPVSGGRMQPLCAAYSRRDALPAVSAALDGGVRAVHRMVEGLGGVEYVEELRAFGDPELFLMNVNSPEDLERARARSGGTADR